MRVRVFRREGNNQYYFQFLRDDGQVILNSEGYTTEAARDNGVQSVINNSGNADRYETRTNDAGGFYFILKAGNNQEIGRSVTFRNEGARDGAVTLMQGEAAGVQGGGGGAATTAATTAAAGAATIEPYKAKGDEDDYKPLNFYETNGGGTAEGFDSFSAEDEHYFSYNIGGTVYLISEGYNSTGARDNGVQSVTNNMNNADRYQRQQHPNGKFFFNLKAGNNREIATSRWFDSQGDMDAIIARLVGGAGGRRVQEGTQLTAANRDANINIAAPPPPRDMGQPKKKRKKRTTPKKPKAEKVYVANGNYLFNDVTYQVFRSGNNRYYFTFKNKEEKTLFLNADVRGFETQEQAEAKIAQIMLYAPYEENYEGKQARNGKYYFYIKGEEGKNIGKSFFYGTSEDMQASVGLLLGSEAQMAALAGGGGATAAAGATAGGGDAAAAKGNVDEYLACSAYASNTDGFTKFKHDGNGEFYFGYNHGGKTYLRSEGYTAEKSRDNGIESVTKNAPNDDRWKTMKDEDDGMWYYSLRAGNNQEIARSCGYESEAAMNTAWGWIRGEESPMGAGAQYIGGVWYSGAWMRRKKEEEEAAKRAAEAAAAKKAEEEAAAKRAAEAAAAKKAEEEAAAKRAAEAAAAKKAEEEAAAKRAAEAAAKRAEEEATARRAAEAAAARKAEEEAAAKKKAAAVAAAATAAAALAATKKKEEAEALAFAAKETKVEKVVKVVKDKDKEDDYLPCKAYEGHAVNDKINNIAFFRAGEDNQYYFALYNEDGSVRLRSEGFRTAKERDEELSGVVRLKDNKEFYKRIEKGKYFLEILYDESGREVGRSCLNEVAAAAPVVKKDKEDDYLPCKEYEGHTVNDKVNNIAFFKGEDNQFYFAAYDDNGNVKLRSEGFGTAKERDEELSGVVRLKNNKDFYKRIEKGKYYMDILYDETGREVGRSCLRNAEAEAKVIADAKAKKEKAAAVAAATAAAALAATRKKEEEAALALKAKEEKIAAAKVVKPVKKKAAAAKVVTTAKKEKVVAAAAATTEGSGTWGWLPWLLLLGLIPLLWFTKGCYGCDDAATIPTPMDVSSVVVPPVQKVAPPAAPTCACNNTDCSVMNLPSNGRAQVLTRLGTNPEFGNAHGLTGPQFLGRLRNRYATEAVDKRFLDGLFTCMGYTNGFADATADMFTEVTLPNGKTGNMGYGKGHGTTYTTLNARDAKDLEAYRIKAANGCDVHFMKTCGNHFFFCN